MIFQFFGRLRLPERFLVVHSHHRVPNGGFFGIWKVAQREAKGQRLTHLTRCESARPRRAFTARLKTENPNSRTKEATFATCSNVGSMSKFHPILERRRKMKAIFKPVQTGNRRAGTLVSLLLAVVFLAAANAKADTITFTLDHSKDPKVADLLPGFQFMFEGSNDSDAVTLTFDLTDYGYAQGYDGGNNKTVKFKAFNIEFLADPQYIAGVDGLADIFNGKVTDLYWDNEGWTPTTAELTFADGITWDMFAESIAGFLEISAHIQSIFTDWKDGESINEAVFKYDDGTGSFLSLPGEDDASTPEPATLVLMGLGLAGVGAAARRRMKK